MTSFHSKLSRLNTILFHGQPVLYESAGIITIDTGLILLGNTEAHYVARTNDYAEAYTRAYVVQRPSNQDQTTYVAVVASPVAVPQPKSMIITVPQGAGPGSVLTVATPSGSTVTVVVPEGTHAGQDMVVQY